MSALSSLNDIGMLGERECNSSIEWSKFLESADMMLSDYILPVFNFYRKFEVTLPSRADWKEGRIQSLVEDCVVTYTDGLRIDHKGQEMDASLIGTRFQRN